MSYTIVAKYRGMEDDGLIIDCRTMDDVLHKLTEINQDQENGELAFDGIRILSGDEIFKVRVETTVINKIYITNTKDGTEMSIDEPRTTR